MFWEFPPTSRLRCPSPLLAHFPPPVSPRWAPLGLCTGPKVPVPHMVSVCWAVQMSASTPDLSQSTHCPRASSTWCPEGTPNATEPNQPADSEFPLCRQPGLREEQACLISSALAVHLPCPPVWALVTFSGACRAPLPDAAVVVSPICLPHQRRVLSVLVSAEHSVAAWVLGADLRDHRGVDSAAGRGGSHAGPWGHLPGVGLSRSSRWDPYSGALLEKSGRGWTCSGK